MRRAAGNATIGIVLAILACACRFDAAVAAEPGAGRGTGLVPTPRKTREELVREWDLNSDGKIDQGEAEVAASRMRRERAELRLNSGIDPVTGLPRDGSEDAEPDDADQSVAADESPPPDPDESPALPGTRVPRPKVPTPAVPRPGTRTGDEPADSGSRADATGRRQPITGGVRAGGLPARAGYGAGVPATPLNAGQPVPPRTPPTARSQQPIRGGLLPTQRTAPRPPTPPPASRDLYDPY